jgi:hypothetical protein
VKYGPVFLPHAAGFLGDGLMVSILASCFLIMMTEQDTANRSFFVERVTSYGGELQRYVAITAQTSAIAASANLILLLAVGVDFPLLWCALYFFMSFIPNVGFIIAIIPPILLALVMLGWKTALFVTGGLVVVNLMQEYGLNPMLMKKGVDISFIEIILSLTVWSFLLGPAGAVTPFNPIVPSTQGIQAGMASMNFQWSWSGSTGVMTFLSISPDRASRLSVRWAVERQPRIFSTRDF